MGMEDHTEFDQLVPLLQEATAGFTDTIAFAAKSALFGGLGDGRTIDINIQGRTLDTLFKAAPVGFQKMPQAISDAFPRPFPGLELAQPELRLISE